ncbi:snurportin-1 [Diachasma alloeum]|uniref:snurportin-1 n=1 Tax=Diachasma alloeum TaxID=454923 RepID=UPI000738400F|nr:snurportin-1 [Diachasma alloeum]XP_015112784.1 snurportin-1 [Diachasma alloeum]
MNNTSAIMSLENTKIETTTGDGRANRMLLYKKPIKKDNYKVEAEWEETPQEVRRKRLLHHQKECRDVAFNAGRVIVEDLPFSEEENQDPMDVEKARHGSRRHTNKRYANKLMMSEWMLDVPGDLVERWSMVPCPKGRRNLLVARKGRTEAYTRRGEKLTEFQSALPGGHADEMNRSYTLLDCIWVPKQKIYYVLDVLAWSTQPLLNCDAEFRRFWLQSKLQEDEDLRFHGTKRNQFPILPLPSVSCDNNLSEFLDNLPPLPPLDGLLFYHKEGYYMHGFTPLVTWLKPYMLPEILGVSVPPPMDDKPEGYVDLMQHISFGLKGKKISASSELFMETATDG